MPLCRLHYARNFLFFSYIAMGGKKQKGNWKCAAFSGWSTLSVHVMCCSLLAFHSKSGPPCCYDACVLCGSLSQKPQKAFYRMCMLFSFLFYSGALSVVACCMFIVSSGLLSCERDDCSCIQWSNSMFSLLVFICALAPLWASQRRKTRKSMMMSSTYFRLLQGTSMSDS